MTRPIQATKKRVSKRFHLYVALLFVLNLLYVSVELYTWKFSHSLGELSALSKAEVIQLDALAGYSFFVEMAMIAAVGLTSILFIKKVSHLPRLVRTHMLYLLVMFVLGCVVAFVAHVPIATLTQQLVGPLVITLAVYTYSFAIQLPKKLLTRKGVK